MNDSSCRQIVPYAELEDKDLLNELRDVFEGYAECSAVAVVSGKLPLSFANIGRVPVSINLYGPQKHKDAMGDALQVFDLYLQNPESVRAGIFYDNPHVLGSVDQKWIGQFSEEFRWRSAMRLIIYNFMPLEHETLQLIKPSFESGMSKEETKMVEKLGEGAIPPDLELAPCPCLDCTSRS